MVWAALLGVLHSQVFVHPRAWPAQLVLVAAVAYLAWQLDPWRAARFGLIFGTAWLASGTWWLYISMHQYGGLPAWMAILAIALLSAFLSLYMSAALGLFAALRSGVSWRDACLFASLWLLAELARGVSFTDERITPLRG